MILTSSAHVSRRDLLRTALLALGAVSAGACTAPVPTAGPPSAPTAAVSQPTAVATAPAQAASEVALGLVLSLSGRFSREGALMRAGYETWLDAVNSAGGLKLGARSRTVRLVVLDDESEALNATRQAERLAATHRALLWLGPFTSTITTAVATVADRVGALVVAPDGSAAGLYRRGLKGLVSVLAPDDRLFHGLADLAATADPRAQPIGVLIADEPSNAAAVAGFRERAANLDLGPVRLELTALGSSDISAPLERIAEITPRCVILATEPGQTARFAPSLREIVPFAGMRVLAPLPGPEQPGRRRDTIYDGIVTVETWSPSISARGPVLGSAQEFVERFRRLHGYDPDSRSAAAAAAGLALQLAIEKTGSTEPAALRDAFATLDVTTFWGRMAWDLNGRNRVAQAPVVQQQGDTLVTVYPRELAGGKLRYPLSGWPRG